MGVPPDETTGLMRASVEVPEASACVPDDTGNRRLAQPGEKGCHSKLRGGHPWQPPPDPWEIPGRQTHKRFTNDQTRFAFGAYVAGRIKSIDVQEALAIGKRRCFGLLREDRHTPPNAAAGPAEGPAS